MKSVKEEKYILAAVSSGDEESAWDSLDELSDLLETAGKRIKILSDDIEAMKRARYTARKKHS